MKVLRLCESEASKRIIYEKRLNKFKTEVVEAYNDYSVTEDSLEGALKNPVFIPRLKCSKYAGMVAKILYHFDKSPAIYLGVTNKAGDVLKCKENLIVSHAWVEADGKVYEDNNVYPLEASFLELRPESDTISQDDFIIKFKSWRE